PASREREGPIAQRWGREGLRCGDTLTRLAALATLSRGAGEGLWQQARHPPHRYWDGAARADRAGVRGGGGKPATDLLARNNEPPRLRRHPRPRDERQAAPPLHRSRRPLLRRRREPRRVIGHLSRAGLSFRSGAPRCRPLRRQPAPGPPQPDAPGGALGGKSLANPP